MEFMLVIAFPVGELHNQTNAGNSAFSSPYSVVIMACTLIMGRMEGFKVFVIPGPARRIFPQPQTRVGTGPSRGGGKAL